MTNDFKAVNFEGFSPIAKAIGGLPFCFCDFTPYVIMAWQKYYNSAFAVLDGLPILRHTVDGESCYTPLTTDTVGAVNALLKNADGIRMSLLTEAQVKEISHCFSVTEVTSNDGWSDYVYLRSDLAELSGKRYAGQRNHINKLLSQYPDTHYEEITSHNLSEVLEFYKELTANTSELDETALYERDWLLDYLDQGFYKLPLSGGLIRANGRIISFAFGEVIHGMLFVHIEKAIRDVQGAYQMIVREFARHNTAELINREEDMGIAGLRTSKLSYHPIRLERKYKIKVTK